MKQKDIMLIAVVAIASGLLSIFLSNLLIVPKKAHVQQAEVVPAIQGEISAPDPKYFNSQSIDTTQLITIGGKTNPIPFNGAKQ